MAVPRLCSIEDCDNRAYARTWCLKHYTRWQRHGSPHDRTRAANGEPLAYLHSLVASKRAASCVIWPFHWMKNGYPVINLAGAPKVASRVICERVHGPAPDSDIEAAHSCGNGHLGCVNPAHISWKTKSQNAEDKRRHGTLLKGSAHPSSRLTDDDVREIRKMCTAHSARAVARHFGVSHGTVNRIRWGQGWQHVT